jgi:hypothetical protein
MAVSVEAAFDFNDSCIDELAASDDLVPALEDMASVIGDVAQGYAPRHIAPTITILGGEIDEAGAVVYVGSADPFAHLWEFGSVNTETYGFMRAAGSEVGESFDVS